MTGRRVVDVRFVLDSGYDELDLIDAIGKNLEYVLGAVELANTGFGHMLPANEPAVFMSDPDGKIAEALKAGVTA